MRRAAPPTLATALLCLLAAACGTSSVTTSAPSSTTSPPTNPVPATSVPDTSVPETSVPGTTLTAPSTTTSTASAGTVPPTTPPTTAYPQDDETIVDLVAGRAGPGSSWTFTANPVTTHCGGPDDLQYDPDPGTVERVVVPPTARVQLLAFGPTGAEDVPGTPATLAASLTTDPDTRTYRVTGSLDAVTGIQALYHP